jgi:hypothetical protein
MLFKRIQMNAGHISFMDGKTIKWVLRIYLNAPKISFNIGKNIFDSISSRI